MFPRWGQEKVINVFIYHDNTIETIITFCPHKLSLKIYFRIALDGSLFRPAKIQNRQKWNKNRKK